jgi:hypothetical protein
MQQLRHPVAFGAYAVVGVAAAFLAGRFLPDLGGFDAWQWATYWLALLLFVAISLNSPAPLARLARGPGPQASPPSQQALPAREPEPQLQPDAAPQATTRVAWQRLLHPVAFGVYVVSGVVAVWLADRLTGGFLGFDLWQLEALWLALIVSLAIYVVKADVTHKGVWISVVVVVLTTGWLAYGDYLALRSRLDTLHGDVTAQAADVRDQLIFARFNAETLSTDLVSWDNATGVVKAGGETKVTSDFANLRDRTSEARSHLQGVVKLLSPTAQPAPQNQASAQFTVESIRNLADDAVQETEVLSRTLSAVDQAWQTTRTAPGSHDDLIYAVNPGLWLAIDNASNSAQRLADALPQATTVPVDDMFWIIAVLNAGAFLFPWLLLLLFVSGRREVRLRQIYMDLWDLGGKRLLTRVLDNVPEESLTKNGYEQVANIRRKLEDRTFRDLEYLLCLGVLTVLLVAGWHLVLYPMGALGLAQLLVGGVSVRDFVMYVVGNLNIVTLGFLGAYFYSIGALIRRFFASDLYPSAYLQMIYRILGVFVVSLALTILIPVLIAVVPGLSNIATRFVGLPTAPNGGSPLDGTTALAGVAAFYFGLWLNDFVRWLSRLLKRFVPGLFSNDQATDAPVTELEGINVWVEGRLQEEGIETVQAMANASIERLVRRTYFTTADVVCWIDQALLYSKAGRNGQWMGAFRAASIHKATDLIGALNCLPESVQPDEPLVPRDFKLALVQQTVANLAHAAESDPKLPKLSQQTILEVGAALMSCEPNLRYVINFYYANGYDLNQAALASAALGPTPEPDGVGPHGAPQPSHDPAGQPTSKASR